MNKYNQLLSINSDYKTSKGTKKGYLTGILYLSPASESGKNLCASASPGCISSCLNTAGRGAFNSVQQARYNKSRYFIENKNAFMFDLVKSIIRLIVKAENKKLIPVVRLNGTSDIIFELIKINVKTLLNDKYILNNIDKLNVNVLNNETCNIFDLFNNITFYDYTKHNIKQRKKALNISNYHLTFSRSENNENIALSYLLNGHNSAFVFSGKLPKTYKGFKVFNGDDTDLRFLDPKNVIIGLIAKGSAKKDTSGFVIHN